jgi:hypothetical protein
MFVINARVLQAAQDFTGTEVFTTPAQFFPKGV